MAIKSGNLKGRVDWKMQPVHKTPTVIKSSDQCKKKITLQICSHKHSHIYTDEHTFPHSCSKKSIIPLKVQMEISTNDSDQLVRLKVSLDLLLG